MMTKYQTDNPFISSWSVCLQQDSRDRMMCRIYRLFEESVSHNFRQIKGFLEQNKLLPKARDLLLPRLMNGEIVT